MRMVLDQVLSAVPPPFALLYRPGTGLIDVLVGEVSAVDRLADIPLPDTSGPGHEALVLVPYRQVGERGFRCADDGTPLTVLTVTGQETHEPAALLAALPDEPVAITGGAFDVADADYAELVARVVAEEIGAGAGANFVLRRSFVADVPGFTTRTALAMFRRLVEREQGTYWTFVIHTGARTLVGASPERHVSLEAGRAVMNPISGTYRYPPTGPTLPEVIEFLSDAKETDELYMVVDEELKMMSRLCATGGRVSGPHLREMARLAHTEYYIEGRTDRDVRDILRETMFAPTVTGSPLENACRVIERHERGGRGYYSGVAALVGRDRDGVRGMDSAILIRTADIDPAGRLRIGVGATLVRHSAPEAEVAETRAKAAGLLSAFTPAPTSGFGRDPRVLRVLAARNDRIASFWLRSAQDDHRVAELTGRRALVVDMEDTFTAMIGHVLAALGLAVTIRRFDEPFTVDEHDLTVLGPGPGDPLDDTDARIAVLDAAVRRLLARERPFLAVCLSHQVLCRVLGFGLRRRAVPNQGAQRDIDLFGRRVRVGFYNSYAAHSDAGKAECAAVDGVVEVSRDPLTGEVHALRGNGFQSMQFHAESVLSRDGMSVLRDAVSALLAVPVQ
jgi:2-amino-4-deoxychorismate synthase